MKKVSNSVPSYMEKYLMEHAIFGFWVWRIRVNTVKLGNIKVYKNV